MQKNKLSPAAWNLLKDIHRRGSKKYIGKKSDLAEEIVSFGFFEKYGDGKYRVICTSEGEFAHLGPHGTLTEESGYYVCLKCERTLPTGWPRNYKKISKFKCTGVCLKCHNRDTLNYINKKRMEARMGYVEKVKEILGDTDYRRAKTKAEHPMNLKNERKISFEKMIEENGRACILHAFSWKNEDHIWEPLHRKLKANWD